MSKLDNESLGTSKEVAKVVRTTQAYMARMRQEGRGPKYIKIGRAVRYRWSDVDAWLAENTHDTSKVS